MERAFDWGVSRGATDDTAGHDGRAASNLSPVVLIAVLRLELAAGSKGVTSPRWTVLTYIKKNNRSNSNNNNNNKVNKTA